MPTNSNTGWKGKFKRLYKGTKRYVASPFKKAYDTAKTKYNTYKIDRQADKEYKASPFYTPPRRIASRAKSWLTKRKDNVGSIVRRGKEGATGAYNGVMNKFYTWKRYRAIKTKHIQQEKIPETLTDTHFLDKFKITKITHPNNVPLFKIYMLEDGKYINISKSTLHTTIETKLPAFYNYLKVKQKPTPKYDMHWGLVIYFPKDKTQLEYDYQVDETIAFVTDLDKVYRYYLQSVKPKEPEPTQVYPETLSGNTPDALWTDEFPATEKSVSRTSSSQRRAKSLSGRHQSRTSNRNPAPALSS
jgi:hypothetical protein